MTPLTDRERDVARLTPRQREIAALVGAGLSYKDIGRELAVSPRTVRVHVNAISQRLPDDGLPAYKRVMIWMLSRAA